MNNNLGQVFTPQYIVNDMLDLVYTDILNKYVLEPSCGDGVFITEIVRRYIKTAIDNNISINDISSMLGKYIYGFEIDPELYERCINNLNSVVSEYDMTVEWKVYNVDTLDVFSEFDFFDYVIGNPPYIKHHNIPTHTRTKIKNKLTFTKGSINTYISFFEMGLMMLNSTGKLCYITPNSFLLNNSNKDFRTHLTENKLLVYIQNFESKRIFDASTYTCITMLDKTNKEDLLIYKTDSTKQVYYNDISENWFFEKTNTNTSLDKIEDFYDVQYGFATLRDKIYISKGEIIGDEILFNNELMERGLFKKIVKASKYKVDDKNYILFPYYNKNGRFVAINESDLSTKYPKTYQYLLKNKEDLLSSDKDKNVNWYELGRSQGVQKMNNDKLCIKNLFLDKIEFFELPADIFMYSGIFVTKKDISDFEKLKEILASPEFLEYAKITSKDVANNYKNMTTKTIKNYYAEISINRTNK